MGDPMTELLLSLVQLRWRDWIKSLVRLIYTYPM